MTQNRRRDRNQREAEKKAELAARKAELPSKPSLIESAEPKVIYYKPEEDEYIPKGARTRWLYYRAQIVLSFLTLAILIIYLVQWLEFRASRELENRAYVVAKGVQVTPATLPTVNDILVSIVNAGRTPGRNGSIIAQMERRSTSPPENTVMNPKEGPASQILFGPQIEVNERVGFMQIIAAETPSPSPERSQSQGKGSPIPTQQPTPTPSPSQEVADTRLWYVYGIIVYEDIFDKSHATRFCFENAPGTASWSYCPTYNHSD